MQMDSNDSKHPTYRQLVEAGEFLKKHSRATKPGDPLYYMFGGRLFDARITPIDEAIKIVKQDNATPTETQQ